MNPVMITLSEGLRLAVARSGRKPTDVREVFRQALLDGLILAEGHVNRPSYPITKWGVVTREFWTTVPDWGNDSTAVGLDLKATGIHVRRADVERHFDAGTRHVLAAELAEQPALWRLGGVETAPSSERGWLLPDAMREFCQPEYGRWREAAFPGTEGRHLHAGGLGQLGVALQRLREDLEDGVLVATGLTEGGRVVEIKPEDWSGLTDLHLYEVSCSVLVCAGKPLTDVRVRQGHAKGGNIRLERRCAEWFREQIASGAAPSSRDEMFKRALHEVDDKLTERAFLRVWDAIAPTTWKLPGKRKRNRRT